MNEIKSTISFSEIRNKIEDMYDRHKLESYSKTSDNGQPDLSNIAASFEETGYKEAINDVIRLLCNLETESLAIGFSNGDIQKILEYDDQISTGDLICYIFKHAKI